MRLLSLTLSAALGLGACLSSSNADDPYACMSCDRRLAAISKEIQDWNQTRSPAAKPAAANSGTAKTDTTQKAVPVLRGNPPVAGLVPGASGYPVAVQDSSRGGYSGPSTGPQWIAPAGFDPVTSTTRPLPAAPNPASETTALSALREGRLHRRGVPPGALTGESELPALETFQRLGTLPGALDAQGRIL